jgi:hypothetical protein
MLKEGDRLTFEYIMCFVVVFLIVYYLGFRYVLKDRRKIFKGFKKMGSEKFEMYDNYHARKENNISNIAQNNYLRI